MKKIALLTLLAPLAIYAQSGEEIFDAKCSSCHTKTPPPKAAPPLMGVAMHLKMAHPDKEGFTKFLVDYVQNPSKEKALCAKKTVKRFGVMPSQKGKVTEDELKKIAEYIYDNFALGGNLQEQHKKLVEKMKKQEMQKEKMMQEANTTK